MKKIAVMGAHSSAKTTRIEFIEHVLGLVNYPLYIVPEAARLCPYDINQNAGFKAQMWMIEKQLKMERAAEKKALENANGHEPIILCDRTLYDMIVYSESLLNKNKMIITEFKTIESRVREIFRKGLILPYDQVYLCQPRPIIDDGVRDTDRGWQLELYTRFKNVAQRYDLPVIELR